MRHIILLLALCFITLQSYAGSKITQRYNMQQLQQLTTKHDGAQLMNWNDFFQRRMLNERWNKKNIGVCEILFETDAYVYYGRAFDSIGHKLIMPEIDSQLTYYKVDKKELLKYFPVYRTVEGYQLRGIVDTNDAVLHPPLESYSINDYTYTISGDKILVGATYKREHQLFPVNARFITYYTYIDMQTLAVK